MILYLDRREVPDLEELPAEVIAWCVRKGEQAAGRYHRLDRYYRGDHDIFHRRREGDEIPVAVNYAKYVVDVPLGYYLGQEVKYDPNPAAGGRGESLRRLMNCYWQQHISRLDRAIGRTMGVMGDCLELCYASGEEDPMPRSALVDPRNGILVCDTSVEHKKLFALVWDRRERPTGERYYAVCCYTDRSCRCYESGDLERALFHPTGPAVPHYFGAVPVICYENNDCRQGDFEQILSLIDAYDELLSSRLTDKKKFVDALLVFYGMTLAPGEEEKLHRERFIDGAPLDARAEYIQKTFDEVGVQVLADALVREMHKMTLTVDLSDEHFAGTASGQALKLKLLAMDQLARGKMGQMERGLRERMALYGHWLAVKGAAEKICPEEVDVVFTLNLPINERERVELVRDLKDMVDEQTLLSQLWFIKDPAEAANNLRREREKKGTAGAAREIEKNRRDKGTGGAEEEAE
ncbi:MAG: phage portal protein [Oscillospiraceae bacterium]|nr:phage portal protein [Oscillospiraceae bacterium]